VCVGNPNDLNVLLGRLVEGSGLGLRGINVGEKIEAESDLGDQVSNGDDANLLGEAERTGALGANDPDDGVHEPHQDGEPGEALEGITAIALSVVEALEEEHEDDDQEDQGGNPPHVLVGSDGQGADETADDVQHHVANEGDDGGGVRAGEEGEVRKDERASDNPIQVVSPEDDTGGGVGGLVLNAETGPLSVVSASGHGGDEEGEHVHHGVNLTGDTHVEEHDGSDEHAQEANQEKVANRVGVVVGEGDGGSILILEKPAALRALQEAGVDPAGIVDFADLFFYEDGKPIELPFDRFMELILDLRGSNSATVKDIMTLWKQINPKLCDQQRDLQVLKDRTSRIEKEMKESTVRIEGQLDEVLSEIRNLARSPQRGG